MDFNEKKGSSNELYEGERQLRLQHRFLVLRKLGQGTYGKVQLALNKETNKEVAVKTIKKGKIENEEDMRRIRREIHIMTSIRHPHIIHINEVFETRQKIVIAMQYASGGELYDYLGCHQTLPEDEARRIFRQIASAIYYCHKNRICHRDLKLENILLDEEGNAKIADFGLSNIFDDKRRMNTFCGSPLYASPEIVKGTPYKGPEVDCWSLGVLLYTLVYGTMPFDGRSFKELVTQISEGRYEEPVNRSNASSLIRWLLTPDISQRATITDVCKDCWINQGYDTSLLEVAENMAMAAGLLRRQKNASKVCLETNTKNGREKSIFGKAAAQIEEKFPSVLTKSFENVAETNVVNSPTQKSILYEQIMNYDVRSVLNKLIATVEATLNNDIKFQHFNSAKDSVPNLQKKEFIPEKVDTAYVIPIFEVTSVIPNERDTNYKILRERSTRMEKQSKIPNGTLPSNVIPVLDIENNMQSKIQIKTLDNVKTNIPQPVLENNKRSLLAPGNRNINTLSGDGCQRSRILLTDSQKQYHSLDISGQSELYKPDLKILKKQEQDPMSQHPSPKTKRVNDGFPFGHKLPSPFMRTKHHVLSLARLLSLNYERLMRNSFKVSSGKKKPPGKIAIPPTFDPNNPPTLIKKSQEDKKELLIFPTVSVSENKEKIEKKIEKIKKAALDKNIIIRSDSKTRLRIEKYIRSQVKKIHDLVCEEQRSIHASLENLDEQSFRDMSEMYYCAFGSENTDSGIANTEDDEYFCFLCSKPNGAQVTSEMINSFVLDSIKKGCLYTSNHLHIPRGKEKNKWNYVTSNNAEFGGLSKSKSEIELPIEYLNYISSDSKKSDLSKRTHQKQHLQENSIGNTKCFLAVTSTQNLGNSNLRILRSASDSVGLHLSNNTFEVVKLNTDSHDDTLETYNESPHFLEHASSSRCDYSQMTDRYETQSSATDTEHTTLISSQLLERDDGIGDSNDSFQSYIEALESNAEISPEISRSKSSHSYLNFIKEDSSNNENPFTKRLSSEPFLKRNYEDEKSEIQWRKTKENMADILDSATWAEIIESENGLSQSKGKNRGLRRRNTMTCVRDETEKDVNLRCKHTCTEFENYLWNAYKEHLLDNTQSDKAFPVSPHLNYYSLDRKSTFKNRDSKSIDYANGECSNDFYSVNSTNFQQSFEEDSNESNYATFRNILKHSNVLSQQDRHRNLSRTKSIAGDTLPGSERDDLLRKLMAERKLSQGHNSYDPNNGIRTPFLSNFLNDLEKKEQGRRVDNDARRRPLKNNLPVKRTKSEYKKSFLQLMAMKRIQEAEKELDKVHRNDFQDVEEENSGSLLEALKTHGYKSVISQRFQDADADSLDPFHTKYLKSPRNRADLARLNYMYYESMPRYNLDSYGENDYIYDDLDYTSNIFNGLATPSFYDMQNDFRQITPKQSIYDWLNTTQSDEYLSTIRSDSLYIPEDTTPSTDARKCCTQWGKENVRSFDDESTSESQDTVEEHISNGTANGISKNKDSIDSSKFTNNTNSENSQLYSTNAEDEKQESVQDRIWRKSFYSRFNNRALSKKERSSFLEPEFLSENRLGLLNNLYNPPRPGYERSEFSPSDGSNKSFKMKRSKKHSSSFKRHESSSNVKQHSAKSSKERDTGCNETSSSNKDSQTFHRKNTEQELEPEH